MNLSKMIFVMVLFTVFTISFAADFAVIIHPDNTVAQLSAAELKNIYLGKKANWNNGSAIEVLVLKEGAIHENFLKEVVKKSPSQFAIYWKKAVFTGTGTPPHEFANEDELKAYVASHPQAIGYVATGNAQGSVKSVTIAP